MAKPLTEQELQDWLVEHTELTEETGGAVWRELEVGTFMYHFKQLIQSQKLAHGEMVIGEDDARKFKSGTSMIRLVEYQNQLRAEQRERNKS